METITVRIAATGEIDYDVKGVKGRKCKDLTKLIDGLAGRVLETKVTGEYCAPETKAQVKQGGA